MPVRVELVAPVLLGRYFQYAFISAAKQAGVEVYVEPGAGFFEFPDERSFVRSVWEAFRIITISLRLPRKQRNCVTKLVDSIDCCQIDRGPQLYRAGRESDSRLLSRLFPGECSPANTRGGTLTGWVYAAINYALAVRSRGGPLCGERGECRREPLPFLAKATLFSVERAASGQGEEAKNVRASLDAIGTVLLGGSIAFLGRITGGGRGPLEFYLLPYTPSREYIAVHSVAAYRSEQGNLVARLAVLLERLSVSFEDALLYAYALQLVEAGKTARELANAEPFARIQLVRPGANRPMIAEGLPFTGILAGFYSGGSLRQLLSLLWRARGEEERRQAERVVSLCINRMIFEASYPCTGHLAECIRVLHAASTRLPGELCSRIARSLYRDWSERCGGGEH